MGYDFQIGKHFRVKANKVYPWPCAAVPDRTLELFTDDVLTPDGRGTFMKHTGLGTFGHVIPEEDLVEHNSPVNLRLE